MENKHKNKTFNLAIEDLGNCNSTENNSWHTGDWHPANRREASLTQEGDEGGEGRAEGWAAAGVGGRAASVFTPDLDGTGPGSSLDAVPCLPLENDPGLRRALFPVLDDAAVLDCMLNGCSSLRAPLYIWVPGPRI